MLGIIIGLLLGLMYCYFVDPGAGQNPQPAPAGMVWQDNNPRNCAMGGVEVGLANVSLELRDLTGTVISTAVTDAQGNYAFPSESVTVAGEYDVVVTSTSLGTPSCDTDDPSVVNPIGTPNSVRVTVTGTAPGPIAEFGYQ